MAANVTQPTEASVLAYLAAIADDARRQDCATLVALMSRATTHPPRMWGAGIVGFGSYHYRYESGREGDSCVVGFSSRKAEIAIYGLRAAPDAETELSRLGKLRTGKGCVYIRRLGDVDLPALEALVAAAATARLRAHEGRPDA